ncbi:MAG: DUF4838 domain-containing protein [Armatimonadetes bacterium]|nr:DUF4838 domain-containing protein [Armatimonadota bacterium]
MKGSLLLVVPCVLLGAVRAHALVIAQHGQARATIVLGSDPTPAEETAARELAQHLERITGATFPVVAESEVVRGSRLLVGPSEEARHLLGSDTVDSLGPEEFIVRTIGEDLLLVGGRPRGTLYAVYSFLEDDLGCRWMTWYGDEDIPRRDTLAVEGIDRRDKPAMAVRDIACHTNTTADKGLMQRFLVRNRCQGPDLNFTGDLSAFGGTSHVYGFPPGGWLVHTLFHWIPPEKHFAEHPEWFSLVGGRRVATAQLCFSNRGLRQALTAAILKRIGEDNPAGTYSVSAMDWVGGFCECPDCRALVEREGTPGAPLFDYLAELGPQVSRAYPDARISTLAYRKEQSEIPPKTIKLPDNVIVIFAPIDDNFAAPIDSPSNAETKRNLEDWTRVTSHLRVWYYPNTYGPALPMGNLGKLASDFRLFKKLGVEGYFVEQDATGIQDSRRVSDLQTWLIAKLMWNPDRDLDALIMDYTDRHYGAAAPMVREYLAALETATARQTTPMTWDANTGQHHYLTPELLLHCQALLDRAEAAVANDPTRLARVQHLRMSVDLACILRWDRLVAAGEVPFTMQQLIDRYRTTYTAAAKARLLPASLPALIAAMDEFLKWYELKTPLKPLPEPLGAVPAHRVRQLTPETALCGKTAALVQDPLAAAGIAVKMEPTLSIPSYAPQDLPASVLNLGFYDQTTGRQQHAYIGRSEPVTTGEYRLYPIGRTALSPQCYVWFDWSWGIQFHEIVGLYDPANPTKQWDLYASVRFEGPAYDPSSTAKENRFYVDRLVLVEGE